VALFSPSFCIITITHRHSRLRKRWPNWTNYDSNWLLIHHILQIWLPAILSVPKPRAVAFQGKRFTLNEKIIAETEAYFEGLDVSYYKKDIEMLKIAISSVSPSKATMLSCMNKYNFAQKCLFSLKITGLFSPCSIWKDIAYISLWLALMQKFVQERKVIRDKCSQCADIGSGISLFKYMWSWEAVIVKFISLDSRNRCMRFINIYPLLHFSLAQILASSSALYSLSVYVLSTQPV